MSPDAPRELLAVTRTATLASGQSIRYMVPKAYDDTVTSRVLVLVHHGRSGDQFAPFNAPFYNGLTYGLIGAGYLVCAMTQHGDNFGNQAAIDDALDAYNYVHALHPVSKVVHLGQSMGGLPALLTFMAGSVPTSVGCAIIAGICDLAGAFAGTFGDFTGGIKAAYGIASDGSDYAAKTSGHDPLLIPAASYDGVRLRCYATPDDTTVPPIYNATALAALVSGHATECDVVPYTGPHGDPSEYQAADMLSFVGRCIA